MTRFGWPRISLSITSVLLLLLSIAGIVWPTHRTKNAIQTNLIALSQVGHNLNQTALLVTGLPDLNKVSRQQIGAVKSYGDNLANIAGQLGNLSHPLAQLKTIWHLSFGPSRQLIGDTNSVIKQTQDSELYSQAAHAISQSQQLVNHQAATIHAVANLLEYDPKVDMEHFKLGSADTVKRLDLAKTGLQTVLARLTSIDGYEDPTLGAVEQQIKQLQTALESLTRTGQTAKWISQVNSAQEIILKNRTTFWRNNSKQITSVIGQLHPELETIKTQWQLLADQYKV